MRIIATILSVVVIAAGVVLGGWWAGWWFKTQDADKQYQVNTHSQGYQQSEIDHLHALYNGWTATTDPGQRTAISAQFCETYQDLTHPSGSVVSEATQLGC